MINKIRKLLKGILEDYKSDSMFLEKSKRVVRELLYDTDDWYQFNNNRYIGIAKDITGLGNKITIIFSDLNTEGYAKAFDLNTNNPKILITKVPDFYIDSNNIVRYIMDEPKVLTSIIHELQHIYDMSRISKPLSNIINISKYHDKEYYYNNPVEFNAYTQQIIFDLEDNGVTIRDFGDDGENISNILDNYSIYGNQFLNSLNKNNKRKFISRLYKYFTKYERN